MPRIATTHIVSCKPGFKECEFGKRIKVKNRTKAISGSKLVRGTHIGCKSQKKGDPFMIEIDKEFFNKFCFCNELDFIAGGQTCLSTGQV